jgi:tetratricopeptide (TPR) repeat protein
VLVRISKMICTAAIASVFCVSVWGQATPAPEKKVKDRAEYDLYESISKEQNPTKRLESLNTWKEKYAETDYKKERLLFYLTTYVQLNQPAKVIETAKQILAMDPKDFTSLYYISLLTPTLPDTSAGALDTGEKAAQGMLGNLDATFAKEKKPEKTSDADWTKARTDMEVVAHKTLGWVAMQRKQPDVAQQEFKKVLELAPGSGEVAYWLAQTIQSQKKVELMPIALFYYARAVAYDGPGALTPEGRKQIDDYLTRAYKGYHGDTTGLPELKATAKTTPIAPAGFTIPSVTDIAKEKLAKEEEFKKSNPQLALWMNVKNELAGANGAQYFESSVKDSGLPKLRGKLVSQSPAVKPKELVLAMSDDTTPEVTLKLSAPMAGKADPGTVIEFEGAVPKTFTQSPFMITMEIEKEKIEGWPAQAAPPAVRRAPPKAGAKKKQ